MTKEDILENINDQFSVLTTLKNSLINYIFDSQLSKLDKLEKLSELNILPYASYIQHINFKIQDQLSAYPKEYYRECLFDRDKDRHTETNLYDELQNFIENEDLDSDDLDLDTLVPIYMVMSNYPERERTIIKVPISQVIDCIYEHVNITRQIGFCHDW